MGRDRGEQPTPDLFSTATVRDGSPSPTNPIPATQPTADASSQRHVLPKNLRKAVKHLSDGELDLLHAATLEEMGRRGRLPPTDQTTNRSSGTDKSSHGRQGEAATVSLTRGQVNAVRAAFKAGIKPSRIARQFGISQSDVRKVLAMDASGRGNHRLRSARKVQMSGEMQDGRMDRSSGLTRASSPAGRVGGKQPNQTLRHGQAVPSPTCSR